MQLPPTLQAAIAEIVALHPLPDLTHAAQTLSTRYRQTHHSTVPFIQSEADRVAYLVMRAPATYAAVYQVLSEVRRRMPDVRFDSLLDLGAGAGAATWAAAEIFAELQQCILLERDRALIQLGGQLAQAAERDAVRQADWRCVNLEQAVDLPGSDLIVCSYSLGELEPSAARRVVQSAWQAARQALVIIEPGTMRGFAAIKLLRAALIDSGAHVVAPCPHARACPLPDDDWCHFAARVERSSLQRRLKAGTLGYEDEKFSYIAVAKQPVTSATARILRHPQRQPGFARLRLCTTEELKEATITKKDKEAWKRVRKSDWGDAWG